MCLLTSLMIALCWPSLPYLDHLKVSVLTSSGEAFQGKVLLPCKKIFLLYKSLSLVSLGLLFVAWVSWVSVTLHFPPPSLWFLNLLQAIAVVCRHLLFLIYMADFFSAFVSSLIGFVTHNFFSAVHQSSLADAGNSGK